MNLTRFNLFFPEKREFFLENQGLFEVAATPGDPANVIPFFSRRIGLSESGTPIPMLAGARMSGRAGSYDLGVVAMKPRADDGLPSENFLVGRIRRSLVNMSTIGAEGRSNQRRRREHVRSARRAVCHPADRGVATGDYEYLRYTLNANSDLSRAVSSTVSASAGEFWDGTSRSISGGLNLRPNHHLNVAATLNRNSAQLLRETSAPPLSARACSSASTAIRF